MRSHDLSVPDDDSTAIAYYRMKELEMKKIMEERKKAKEDEKKARERVREQIEKDKRDRAAKVRHSGEGNVTL